MTTRKSNAFIRIIIVSIVLAFIIPIYNEFRFISVLPNILGVLLSGILASLSIIFGLLTPKDLARFKEDFSNVGRDKYLDFMSNVKFDAQMIFSSLVMSTIIFTIFDVECFPDYFDI